MTTKRKLTVENMFPISIDFHDFKYNNKTDKVFVRLCVIFEKLNDY